MNLFKLLIFGDIGYFSKNLSMLSNICYRTMNINDKFIFLGDNFYENGVYHENDPMWNLFYETFSYVNPINMHAILGNHDYHTNPTCQINNPRWNTPYFYYKKKYTESTDLFFIDTVQLFPEHCNIGFAKVKQVNNNENIIKIINDQLQWLDYQLEKSSIKNKIVFGHYPILTNGYYYGRMTPLYNMLFPLFKKHNVTAYVSGHEHNIQHIVKKEDNYRLHQFVIGSSSENRMKEFMNHYHTDFYNNKNNYLLEISEIENCKLLFDFKNKNEFIEYSILI